MTPLRLAGILAFVCLIAVWQTGLIPSPVSSVSVGAALMPSIIVGGLAVLTVLYGVSAWRGQQGEESLEGHEEPIPGANRRLAFILIGGLAFLALVSLLGFVLPATLCGVGVSRAFDAPQRPKTWAMCLGIAATFWLMFSALLGVNLGPAIPWFF